MDWPHVYLPPPAILTSYHPDMVGWASAVTPVNVIGAAISTAWPVNNKAYFYPFRLTDFATAYQLLFFVGATSSGNIDVGIYDSQKNLIISSGSTGMSATVNTVQALNITDTPLNPGDYLLGVACSTTAGTCFAVSAGDEVTLSVAPIYEQTTALALPNPCNPVFCTDSSPSRFVVGIQLVPTF